MWTFRPAERLSGGMVEYLKGSEVMEVGDSMRMGGGGGWGIVRVGHDGRLGCKRVQRWQVRGRHVAALRQDFTLF